MSILMSALEKGEPIQDVEHAGCNGGDDTIRPPKSIGYTSGELRVIQDTAAERWRTVAVLQAVGDGPRKT